MTLWFDEGFVAVQLQGLGHMALEDGRIKPPQLGERGFVFSPGAAQFSVRLGLAWLGSVIDSALPAWPRWLGLARRGFVRASRRGWLGWPIFFARLSACLDDFFAMPLGLAWIDQTASQAKPARAKPTQAAPNANKKAGAQPCRAKPHQRPSLAKPSQAPQQQQSRAAPRTNKKLSAEGLGFRSLMVVLTQDFSSLAGRQPLSRYHYSLPELWQLRCCMGLEST